MLKQHDFTRSLYCPSCLAFCCSVPVFSICEIDKNINSRYKLMHNSIAGFYRGKNVNRLTSVFLLREYELLFWNEKRLCDLGVVSQLLIPCTILSRIHMFTLVTLRLLYILYCYYLSYYMSLLYQTTVIGKVNCLCFCFMVESWM